MQNGGIVRLLNGQLWEWMCSFMYYNQLLFAYL